MDVRDVRGRAQGRLRARRGAVGLEALEGRALMTGAISDVTALPGAMQVGPMAAAPDHHLWFAEVGHPGTPALASLSDTGAIKEVTLSSQDYGETINGVAPDAQGNVWFTLSATPDSSGPTAKVGKVAPDGTMTEFSMNAGEQVGGATVGPDGNVWAALTGGPNGTGIARVTPNGTETDFAVPGATQAPKFLTAGPDGNVWFVAGQEIGKITPAGSVTLYNIQSMAPNETIDLSNAQLTVGSDGNLWFLTGSGIGRLTPSGTLASVPTPGGTITGLAAGSDGNLWMTVAPKPGTAQAANPGEAVMRMSTQGQTMVLNDTLPSATGVTQLAGGTDPSIWVSEGGGKLARVDLLSVPTVAPPIITPIDKGVLTADFSNTVTGRIVTFQPADSSATPADFQASIDWGDGSTSVGTIVTDPSGGFDVDGTHVYSKAQPGSQQKATITVTDTTGNAAQVFAVTQIPATPVLTPTPWQSYPAGATTPITIPPVVTTGQVFPVNNPSTTTSAPTTPVGSTSPPVVTPAAPAATTTPAATTPTTTPTITPVAVVSPGTPTLAGVVTTTAAGAETATAAATAATSVPPTSASTPASSTPSTTAATPTPTMVPTMVVAPAKSTTGAAQTSAAWVRYHALGSKARVTQAHVTPARVTHTVHAMVVHPTRHPQPIRHVVAHTSPINRVLKQVKSHITSVV